MFRKLLDDIALARKEKISRTIYRSAKEYDDLILGFSIVPDEAIDFLVELFSSKQLFDNGGIEHFLLEINVDAKKYCATQKFRILEALMANAKNFSIDLSRHSIGDFIARAYPHEVAYKSLFELSNGQKNEKHVAFVGLDVLMKRVDKESDIFQPVIKLRNYLLDSWQ